MTQLSREQILQIIESARVSGEKPELFGADLSEAELLRAKLSGAELLRADLGGVDLRGVDLIKVEVAPVIADAQTTAKAGCPLLSCTCPQGAFGSAKPPVGATPIFPISTSS